VLNAAQPFVGFAEAWPRKIAWKRPEDLSGNPYLFIDDADEEGDGGSLALAQTLNPTPTPYTLHPAPSPLHDAAEEGDGGSLALARALSLLLPTFASLSFRVRISLSVARAL